MAMIQAAAVNVEFPSIPGAATSEARPFRLARSYTKVTYRISTLQAMMSVPGTLHRQS